MDTKKIIIKYLQDNGVDPRIIDIAEYTTLVERIQDKIDYMIKGNIGYDQNYSEADFLSYASMLLKINEDGSFSFREPARMDRGNDNNRYTHSTNIYAKIDNDGNLNIYNNYACALKNEGIEARMYHEYNHSFHTKFCTEKITYDKNGIEIERQDREFDWYNLSLDDANYKAKCGYQLRAQDPGTHIIIKRTPDIGTAYVTFEESSGGHIESCGRYVLLHGEDLARLQLCRDFNQAESDFLDYLNQKDGCYTLEQLDKIYDKAYPYNHTFKKPLDYDQEEQNYNNWVLESLERRYNSFGYDHTISTLLQMAKERIMTKSAKENTEGKSI